MVKTLRDCIPEQTMQEFLLGKDTRFDFPVVIEKKEASDEMNPITTNYTGVLEACTVNQGAVFFHKDTPKSQEGSDISTAYFTYDSADVFQESPWKIATHFLFHSNIEKGTSEYEQARKLLEKHGLY